MEFKKKSDILLHKIFNKGKTSDHTLCRHTLHVTLNKVRYYNTYAYYGGCIQNHTHVIRNK